MAVAWPLPLWVPWSHTLGVYLHRAQQGVPPPPPPPKFLQKHIILTTFTTYTISSMQLLSAWSSFHNITNNYVEVLLRCLLIWEH